MITIFNKDLGKLLHGIDTRTFFDINAEPYKFTNDVNCPADFVLAPSTERNNIQKLHLVVWHGFEDQHQQILKLLHHSNNVVVSTVVHPELDHDRHVFVDFMFNRTKAYYSQFPFTMGTEPWYYYNNLQFVNCPLVPAEEKTKIFISPNKTYNGTRIYRKKLVDVLQPYSNIGYLANYDDSGTFLYPHIEFPYVSDIKEIEKQTRPLSYSWWGYCPPHNAYYQNTFISIYGETVEYGESHIVSEKTYDPLIKGHFVLPFSAKGFIALLKSQGILFPSFIDYTYDSIADTEQRFRVYNDEVIRLMNLPLDVWQQEYKNNIDLLYHNKRWFYDRDYDRVRLADYKN